LVGEDDDGPMVQTIFVLCKGIFNGARIIFSLMFITTMFVTWPGMALGYFLMIFPIAATGATAGAFGLPCVSLTIQPFIITIDFGHAEDFLNLFF